MATVVVVDDEPDIADAVATRLRAEGFDVEVARDGPGAVELIQRVRPDLVVLDVMLPGFDGLEVCRRVQAVRRVPVLMLTARDTETDLLVGLAVGADDYLRKPFSPRELVARVRAILRRTEHTEDSVVDQVAVADILIDVPARTVIQGEEAVHLTPTEFDLLVHLASKPGVVFTREQLLSDVWGYRGGSGFRTVDSHVRALRSKLGPDAIRTAHGVGYSVPRS